MNKCKYCGKQINEDLEFCHDECRDNFAKMLEKDGPKVKYFIFGIILGILVMFYGIFSGSNLKVGFGIVWMGITVILLPFTTPETTAVLGYRRSKIIGRLLGILLIIAGIWTSIP